MDKFLLFRHCKVVSFVGNFLKNVTGHSQDHLFTSAMYEWIQGVDCMGLKALLSFRDTFYLNGIVGLSYIVGMGQGCSLTEIVSTPSLRITRVLFLLG